MLTLNKTRQNRISVAKLTQRAVKVPTHETIEVEPVAIEEVEEPKAKTSTALQYLIGKNPALADLVTTLDLFEVSKTRTRPEPLPELPGPVYTEALDPRLRDIAQRTFARNTAYSEQTAIERLASVTNVAHDRARNGINKMIAQGILSPTLSNLFYLTESTPF